MTKKSAGAGRVNSSSCCEEMREAVVNQYSVMGLMQVLFSTMLRGKKKSLSFIIFGFCVCVTFYVYLNQCSLVLCTPTLLKLSLLFFTIQYKTNIIAYFETTIDRSIDR